MYLHEEIAAEALNKTLGGCARFLDVIAAASGRWLNYSKLSSDAEIPSVAGTRSAGRAAVTTGGASSSSDARLRRNSPLTSARRR